jgi:hypothetical protein
MPPYLSSLTVLSLLSTLPLRTQSAGAQVLIPGPLTSTLTDKGAGCVAPVIPGTYVYLLLMHFADGTEEMFRGTVILVK